MTVRHRSAISTTFDRTSSGNALEVTLQTTAQTGLQVVIEVTAAVLYRFAWQLAIAVAMQVNF